MNTVKRILPAFTLFAVLLFMGETQKASAQYAGDDQIQMSDQAGSQEPPQDGQPDQSGTYNLPPAGNRDDQAQAGDQPQYDDQGSPSQQSGPADRAPAPPAPSGQATLNQNAPDVPARAARLQYISGSISVQPRGTGDWATGEVNRPLTNSDNVWADKNSRAELSVGTGLVRLDSETSLTLTNIDENIVQLQLHQGAMMLHVRRLFDNEAYEVDTPNQAFTVSKPGDYRFDVDSNGDTTVITVWRGEGKSTGNGPELVIHENEQARFTGSNMEHQIHAAPRPDDFDQWSELRDGRLDHAKSSRYVSPDVPGYEDLDEYGVWKETPDYGPIWVPGGVAVGWAPYRFGHWIWVAPWGWTWVESEPWGYAPFHYGRWVYWGGGWGWAPGPVYARPYYAPALVAWFGGGWGVGFGGGIGFGWCALGWGEPFVPWYGYSRGYFGRVNFVNTRFVGFYNRTVFAGHYGVVNGYHYANMHVGNGFTAVSRETLVGSRDVAHNALRLSPNEMSRMTAVRSVGVRPTSASVMGGARSNVSVPSRSFAGPTVSHMTPPNVNRGGFGNAGGGFARNGSQYEGARQPVGARSVPRPPSSTFGSQGYGGRSMGAPSRGYSSPGARGYGSGPYARSMPSYGGRNYGGAPYGRSAPTYGGGRGGTSRGPSGGGNAGGGGHVSAPSGGGGGGGHSGGESHGGHR